MLDWKEKFKDIEGRCAVLEAELSDPAALKDQRRYADLTRRHRDLNEFVEAYKRMRAIEHKLSEAREMAEDADPDIRAMAEDEIAQGETALEAAEHELRVLLLPADPRDARNTVIEIRAGTGGDEAGLFARDLFELYGHYAEGRGWKIEVLSAHPSDVGGFKEIFFLIKGDRVYSRLKHEGGTHRVQRVPMTETQGRIHTSAVTVAVMPEAEEVDVKIKPEDLQIDVFRSGGPGGQSVNTTDSAVRVRHIPSGLVVSCQDEKSQHKNKARALQVLRSRLFDLEMEKAQEAAGAERRAQVGTGDRSGRIRTYNFPQNRLTDHRINLTIYSLDRAMQGEIDEVLDALAAHYQTEALKKL